MVPSKGWRVIRLGFKFPVDADIRPRSGLAAKYGVTVLNTPGTIDGDYVDEWKVILMNHGEGSFRVSRGDRIAQVLFVVDPGWSSEARERDGGFGSTGGNSVQG